MTELRNIAIIAHVDHGKTTLVDQLLLQSGAFRSNQKHADRAMDSNDLERERGITILAKCASVEWDGVRINIVDTPGHADFGGEVERIMSMVDGVLLLVDAAEGPMPQTKFVTTKALQAGLKPILIVNKVDKHDARPYEVQNEVFDLFISLEASDEQLSFPTIFASAKNGWAREDTDGSSNNMSALFDTIIQYVKAPDLDNSGEFSMIATLLELDPYLGRVLTGRIHTGNAEINAPLKAITQSGSVIEHGRIRKLLAFRGLERVPVVKATAGDLIAIAGLSTATVSDTLADPSIVKPIPAPPIDPPILAMTFSINNSPLAGTEGTKVTSRAIRDRLRREVDGNVAIQLTESETKDAFEVAGRGELQLGVLIEQMRREGFELSISCPRVLYRKNERTGEREEPIEEVVINVDEEYSGGVVKSMNERKAEMTGMWPGEDGKIRITFLAPSRGLIGYHSQFLTETRGSGIMNRVFFGYALYKGPITGRRMGVLVSNALGSTVAYSLWNLEARGILFVGSGIKVYKGMIIGENNRAGDLDVNPMKAKQLTNIRASSTDENIRLTTPRRFSLEQALSYIENDELVEVTPDNIRLRKQYLDPHERKKAMRIESTA